MGMVHNFFRTSLLPKQLNHSLIFLIPKQENRTFITYFRPVSLCNIAYKVIAKIMADRLRKVLGMLIKFPQATFVTGRSIQENTIIAQQIFHAMKLKQGRKGLAAIKIDMERAYDRLDWVFFVRIMHAFEFDPKWIQWIYQCISNVSFSVLMNGLPFEPQRGIRQGDPLSHLSSFYVRRLSLVWLCKKSTLADYEG